MMPKSTIWRHFTEIGAEKKVTCLYCPQQLSVSNKSTCSLIRHMKKKHPNVKIQRLSSTEGQSSKEEILLVNNDDTDFVFESPEVLEYEIEEQEDSEADKEYTNELNQIPSLRVTHSATPTSKPNYKPVEQQVIAAMTEARRQIGDALQSMKSLNKRQICIEDEYDHFGHMIASKIRKIQDMDMRETVMHSVYNVVYESLMKNI